MSINNRIRYFFGLQEADVAKIKRDFADAVSSADTPRRHEIKANEALVTAAIKDDLKSIALFPLVERVEDMFYDDISFPDQETIVLHARKVARRQSRGRALPPTPWADSVFEVETNDLLRVAVTATNVEGEDGDGPMWEAFNVAYNAAASVAQATVDARRAAAYRFAAEWVSTAMSRRAERESDIEILKALAKDKSLNRKHKALYIKGELPLEDRVEDRLRQMLGEALNSALGNDRLTEPAEA